MRREKACPIYLRASDAYTLAKTSITLTDQQITRLPTERSVQTLSTTVHGKFEKTVVAVYHTRLTVDITF